MMCAVKKSIGLALAAVGIVFAQSAPQWQNLYPAYNGLAFGDGKFVAVSGDGLIRTTTDGETWSQSFINDADGNSRRIYAVAFGGGKFVAVQNKNKSLHSGDGVVWSSVDDLSSIDTWKHIVYGLGYFGPGFVAVGAVGNTALIDDEGGDGGNAGDSLSHVAYGAERFVAVGKKGIKSSIDGAGWGNVSGGPTTPVSVVAYDGNKFVALLKDGSTAYTSTDGQSWTNASATGVAADMIDMIFDNGKFVAVGKAGRGCVSTNGTSWTPITLNPEDDFTAVKYGNNMFLALGAKGSVYKSSDGTAWSQKATYSAASFKQIAYNGTDKYAAVGDSGVWVSSDGKKWEKKNNTTGLNGVAFGGNRFVAVSGNGITVNSANGDEWTDGQPLGGDSITSIAFGDGIFIAGGRTGSLGSYKTAIYKSTDGQQWTGLYITPTNGWDQGEYMVSLCFGDGKFLAAAGGTGATAAPLRVTIGATATLGEYWGKVEAGASSGLPSDAAMVSAVYSGNKFIAVGAKSGGASVVIHSGDASSWTVLSGDIRQVRSAASASIGGASATFVAVADSGNVYAYINNAWVRQGRATNRNLYTVYSGNNIILAAGANGAMLYSNAPPTSVRPSSASRVATSSKAGIMTLDRVGRTSSVTLSFTPNKAGTIAVYSLSGRQLYKARLGVGERSARLPERVMSSGSVIVRYSGEGRNVSQRFLLVR